MSKLKIGDKILVLECVNEPKFIGKIMPISDIGLDMVFVSPGGVLAEAGVHIYVQKYEKQK